MTVRAPVLFALFAALVGIVFYWPVLTGERSFFLLDINEFFEPLTRYAVERIRDGQFPLWNPYVYCGMPQIAVQSPGIWYLPGAVFLLGSFNQGLALTMILCQVAAGTGTVLLLRHLGWNLAAVIFAGVLAAFNGYIFSMDTNWTMAAGCAWLPWVMLFTLRATTGSAWNAAALAFFLYLLITTGRPEVVLPGLLIATVFAVLSQPTRLGYAKLAAGAVIGVLLSMPMLLPAFEWIPLSRRATGLDPREVLLQSANWYDFIKLVIFPPMGDHRLDQNAVVPDAVGHSGSLFLASSFLSPLAIIFAIFGFLDKTWRPRWWIAGLLVLSIALALGFNTPLVHAFAAAGPALHILRFPVKLLWMTDFALIAAAARGLQMMCGNRPRVAWAAIGATLILLLMNASLIGRHWAGPNFFQVASIAADTIKSTTPATYRVTPLFHRLNFAQPEWMRKGDKLEKAVASAEYDRMLLFPNTNVDFHIPSAWGFEAAARGDYYQAFAFSLANSSQASGLMPDGSPVPRNDAYLGKILRESATDIVLSQSVQLRDNTPTPIEPLDPEFFQLIKKDDLGNVVYYRVLNARRRTYIEGGSARIVIDRPEYIEIEASAAAAGNLVLCDQFYPGWHATVDGARVGINKHNAFFRSVSIPAGTHKVVFTYDPQSWKLGLLLAAVGAIGLIALAASTWLVNHKHGKAVEELV